MIKDGIYFDEKLEGRRKRMLKIKIYGGLTVFLLLLIGAGYLIVYSPLFQIKDISIFTTSDVVNLGTSDVQKLEEDLKLFFSNQSKIASFLGPNNILVWKAVSGVSENLRSHLRESASIAELNIEKDYFERTIKITIKERERFGVWCFMNFSNISRINSNETRILEGDSSSLERDSRDASSLFEDNSRKCKWFDKNSILFAEAPIVEGALINKVSDFTNRPLEIGAPVLEQRFFDNLLKILAVLEETNLGKGFLNLKDLNSQEIIFESPAGFKIYFSLRINPQFSLSGIKSLKEIGLEKMDYVDFRVENRVYYKLK